MWETKTTTTFSSPQKAFAFILSGASPFKLFFFPLPERIMRSYFFPPFSFLSTALFGLTSLFFLMAPPHVTLLSSNPNIDFCLLRPTEEDPTHFILGPSYVEDPEERTFLFFTDGIPLMADVIFLGT